jgi:hypothetical protein
MTRIRLTFSFKVPKGTSKDNSDKMLASMGRIIWNERSYQHRTVEWRLKDRKDGRDLKDCGFDDGRE